MAGKEQSWWERNWWKIFIVLSIVFVGIIHDVIVVSYWQGQLAECQEGRLGSDQKIVANVWVKDYGLVGLDCIFKSENRFLSDDFPCDIVELPVVGLICFFPKEHDLYSGFCYDYVDDNSWGPGLCKVRACSGVLEDG